MSANNNSTSTRKTRPDMQVYRPGMLRGKNVAINPSEALDSPDNEFDRKIHPLYRSGNSNRRHTKTVSTCNEEVSPRGSKKHQKQRQISTDSTLRATSSHQKNNSENKSTALDSESDPSSCDSAKSDEDALTFEKMCQDIENFVSLDWSLEMERESTEQWEKENKTEEVSKQDSSEKSKKRASDSEMNKKNLGGESKKVVREYAAEKPKQQSPIQNKNNGGNIGKSFNPRELYQRKQHVVMVNAQERCNKMIDNQNCNDKESGNNNTIQLKTTGRLAGRITFASRL